MPTLDAIRSAGEADLQDILKGLDERHKEQVKEAVRFYGRVQDVPLEVWDAIRRDMEGETVMAFYLLMIASDDWTDEEIRDQGGRFRRISAEDRAGYSIDAARRASETARKTTDTLRDRLGRRIEDAKLDRFGGSGVGEMTQQEIDQAVDDVFDQARRDSIAASETTGAMSQGQMGAGGRASQSVQVELRWVTEQDNKVCPRCSPLNGTTEEVWGLVFPEGPGPEAHPNCRCFLEPKVVVEENQDAA